MDEELKKNISKIETWKRALFMLLYTILYSVAEVVLAAVVVFQFLSMLFTGRSNEALLKFGKSLSQYIYEIMLFLTFNSEDHSYPLGEWPGGDSSDVGGRKIEPTEV